MSIQRIRPKMIELPKELAPCGVFCGACPSFSKTCQGCSSKSKDQKRTSKWGCKIRKCCYEEHAFTSCASCTELPCVKLNKKLIDSHPENPKFAYRHEIEDNFKKFRELGPEAYLAYQVQRWTCPECGGRVLFYEYVCRNCGKPMVP